MTSETITADAAGTWTLGDHSVHRIGLGAMRLTGSAAFHLGTPSDRTRSIAVLRKAVELGVNHIDTAAFYFSALRSANELINSALAPYPDDLLIATKVGPHREYDGEWGTAARPDQLRGHVEENLRQLGRDHLDLVYLRRMRQDSIAEHFGALAELREAGLIRHLGISDVHPRAPGRGAGHRAGGERAEPFRARAAHPRRRRAAAPVRGTGDRLRAVLRHRRRAR
jgi:aryl-alcohol dehydrogenase-like predicted oxidoreductase